MHTYLPGLDAIRLLAAVVVVLFHVGQRSPSPIFPNGHAAVYLFFALSGFLITYLLIAEKRRTGTISVRGFYLRRALRILPLYYLIVIITALLPSIRPPATTTFLSATFLAPMLRIDAVNALSHLWSIGVEELFYLIFPPLVGLAGVVPACLTMLALRVGIDLRYIPMTPSGMLSYHIEFMAVGGLVAWACVHWSAARRAMFARVVAWPAGVLTLLSLLSFATVTTYALAVVQSVALANVALNPTFPKVEIGWINWLGKRTYGIYMWHNVVIFALLPLGLAAHHLPFLLLTLALTVGLAIVSYQYFELPVMRLRRGFRHHFSKGLAHEH